MIKFNGIAKSLDKLRKCTKSSNSSRSYLPLIVGILGAALAVIQSITKLNSYHENWIQYRTTCELLKYHKFLYLTQTSPYNTSEETIENLFIRNVEDIISSENSQWKLHASEDVAAPK